MKERYFKVNETMFEATKIMDDRTAGRFFKAVCDYAFNNKIYTGNDVTIKSNFLLVKRVLDGEAIDKANGKKGAIKSLEIRKKKQEEAALKQMIVGCGIVEGILQNLNEDEKK